MLLPRGITVAEEEALDRNPVPDEDAVLLDRILGGDSAAFEDLLHRHEKRVYRVAVAITGNEQDAEDATQNAFVNAYKHLSGFRRTSKFSTWLTRIAVNEALQIRRNRRNAESLDELVATDDMVMPKQLQDWHDDPEKLYGKQQIREIVEQAIQSLPIIYREVFVLRDVQGLTTEEAAEALGIAIPALKSRILRARLMMREALAGYFQVPEGPQSRTIRARLKLFDAISKRFRQPFVRKEEK